MNKIKFKIGDRVERKYIGWKGVVVSIKSEVDHETVYGIRKDDGYDTDEYESDLIFC